MDGWRGSSSQRISNFARCQVMEVVVKFIQYIHISRCISQSHLDRFGEEMGDLLIVFNKDCWINGYFSISKFC